MPLTLDIPLDPASVAAFQWVAAQQGQPPEHITATLIQAYVQQYRRAQLAHETAAPTPLVNLNIAELQALAVSELGTAEQERLAVLLADNHLGRLSPAEESELTALLERLDTLNVLKDRAEYTLQQLAPEP